VFAFDADANGGPYRLVATPMLPVQAAALPPLAAALVAGLALSELRFGDVAGV
jgi:hypothetical protein